MEEQKCNHRMEKKEMGNEPRDLIGENEIVASSLFFHIGIEIPAVL